MLPTPRELAQTVYTKLTEHPELHDNGKWGGAERCIGGWACHEAGITIRPVRESGSVFSVSVEELPEGLREQLMEEHPEWLDYSIISPSPVAKILLALDDEQVSGIFYVENSMALKNLAYAFGF